MHLMALGAFWPARAIQPGRPPASVLMHLMALGAFWPSSSVKRLTSALSGLNAPYGARCFLAARRIAPPVTRGNAMSDRQWSKKHPSYQQAQG